MYLFQGEYYSKLTEVPEEHIARFINNPLLKDSFWFKKGELLFWEEHYLKLMATMRILRIQIPMKFTMEYLEEQMKSLLQHAFPASDSSQFTGKVSLHLVKAKNPTPSDPIPETFFWFSASEAEIPNLIKAKTHIDLYKDHYRLSGLYNTLGVDAAHWKSMAWVYAYENGFYDAVLLNEKKNIAATLLGALFLVKGNTITTPPLSEGGVKSVYRQLLLEVITSSEEYTLEEAALSPFAIQRSDELFVLAPDGVFHSMKQYRKKEFVSSVTETLFGRYQTKLGV